MKTFRICAAALAVLLVAAHGASAQDGQKKKQKGPPQQQQQTTPPPPSLPPPLQKQQGPAQAAPRPGPAACVPSGFARLSRNCATNTGACQRMPDQCNLGWCCP